MYYLRSDLLALPHGMVDRHNGVSASPFSSLNVSYGVGDRPEHVARNRSIIKQALGVAFFLSAKQIHGPKIFCSTNINADTEVEGFDALITDQPGVGLIIQQADCQAILMHDPVRNIIAAIHNGWRGTTLNIIGETVAEMQNRYKTEPSNLFVAISPSLGPCCAEFINYKEELPAELHGFQEKQNHFNFWEISRQQLVESGVRDENIDISRICTSCNSNYFSYRRSRRKGKPQTGRNCSVISLPKDQASLNPDLPGP